MESDSRSTAPIRILVDSFADAAFQNAQMGNAREIVSRMDPERFHVSMFVLGEPDARIAARKNTRLIQLPERRKTAPILREFLRGTHELVFYLKSSPASWCYQSLRHKWKDRRTVIGTLEGQSNLRSEPTIAREAVFLWEHTVLRCDYLFSNAKSVQKSLEREYGLKSEIIPTGVDSNYFVPLEDRPVNTRPRVLFAGSLRTYKHPDVVVEAAARFPAADFRLAGAGPLANELRKRACEQNLTNVFLLGPLPAERLRNEYQKADVFLFPSKWEGSPKVILEAAACGLPVIARNDYAPETVEHGETGYLAESTEEIFSCLEGLLKNAELRREMGRKGRDLSKKFDWDLITAQWERVFVRLAEEQEARRAS
jgi:glycosyltransferase involved in cell wall biosynthesis